MLSPGTDAQRWSAGKHVASRDEHAYPRPAGVYPIPQLSGGRVKACHPHAEVISRSISIRETSQCL